MDSYEFDIDEPHPNVDINSLRLYVRAHSVTVEDHELLLTALAQLSDAYLSAVASSVADRADLAARLAAAETAVADLQATVSSLTNPPPSDPPIEEPA